MAYTCSNANANYDGLNGGYIGLGIDEWGNFLNGTNLVSGYTGTNTPTGDNSAYGYGYHPGRIGLRGAGSISWAALTAAYGTNQGSSLPYYPSTLATTFCQLHPFCASGTLYLNEFCWSCPTDNTALRGLPALRPGPSRATGRFALIPSMAPFVRAARDRVYSLSGSPSAPTGTITFSAGHCIDTVYPTAASCPTADSAYRAPAGSASISVSGASAMKVSGIFYTGPQQAYAGPATRFYGGTDHYPSYHDGRYRDQSGEIWP